MTYTFILINNGHPEKNFKIPMYYNHTFTFTGHYVPQLSKEIVAYNKVHSESTINLKGFMVS